MRAAPLILILLLLAGCTAPATLNEKPNHKDGTLAIGEIVAPQTETVDYPADDSFDSKEGKVDSAAAKNDTEWGRHIMLRASTEGFHFNLNQPAKTVDSSADDWNPIFALPAPFRAEDEIFFCGPTTEISVQVIDQASQETLFDGTIQEVPECP